MNMTYIYNIIYLLKFQIVFFFSTNLQLEYHHAGIDSLRILWIHSWSFLQDKKLQNSYISKLEYEYSHSWYMLEW